MKRGEILARHPLSVERFPEVATVLLPMLCGTLLVVSLENRETRWSAASKNSGAAFLTPLIAGASAGLARFINGVIKGLARLTNREASGPAAAPITVSVANEPTSKPDCWPVAMWIA